MELERLRYLLEQAQNIRILVVGDLILDHYVWGRVERISPEAPVPIVEFERETWIPGGAANVAANLRCLGAQVLICGAIGCDVYGQTLEALLQQQNIDTSLLIRTSTRPTTLKTRVLAGQQQLLRIDREQRTHLEESHRQHMERLILDHLPQLDALIFSDYAKGVLCQEILDKVVAECRKKGTWVSFDPKPSSGVQPHGVSLLTPNRKEAFQLAGLHDSQPHASPENSASLIEVGHRLMGLFHPELLLITLGPYGMMLFRKDGSYAHFPTTALEVFDVCGAGDTVVAAYTLAISAGASPEEAALLANLAAGIVVGKVGTATASPTEIFERASFLANRPVERHRGCCV